MNIFGENYPENSHDFIKKCDKLLISLNSKLNNNDCKSLGELYALNSKRRCIRNFKSFENLGYEPNSKLDNNYKENNEIKGLYVFGEIDKSGKVIPKYLGISRTVFRRLRQHGWGKLHNEATLAYLKAIQKKTHSGSRNAITYNKIEEQQKIIRNYKVAILPELNDYDMYFMEVYFAGKWKTEWNTFKTH